MQVSKDSVEAGGWSEKYVAQPLSQHGEKHVVPTPFSGLRLKKIKRL
jgi:hypothetical protein